jgi:hypothetical protein
MEYERSVFRVHQKVMTNNKCVSVLNILAIVFLALGFVNFTILFAGHILYKNGTGVISEALKQYENEHVKNEDVFPSIFIDPRVQMLSFGVDSVLKRSQIPIDPNSDKNGVVSNVEPLKEYPASGGDRILEAGKNDVSKEEIESLA